MRKTSKFQSIATLIFAVILVVIIFWVGWVFIENFIRAEASVKAGILGAFAALTAAIIAHHFSKKREISARHFIEKQRAYKEIFDITFDFVSSNVTNQAVTDDDLMQKMIAIKKSLMIWASPEVLKAWIDIQRTADVNQSPEAAILKWENLYRLIRKDLGHNDSSLPKGELMGLILKSPDHEQYISKIS